MPLSHQHETKQCPRCNASFECKVKTIPLCPCQTLRLSPEQKAYVTARYDDCLCVACLQNLCREYNGQQSD